PNDWQLAWDSEWLGELSELTSEEQVRFMRALTIEAGEPGLAELGAGLVSQLAARFSVSIPVATGLLARLDSALREWTTALRGQAEQITAEVAFDRLCLVMDDPV